MIFYDEIVIFKTLSKSLNIYILFFFVFQWTLCWLNLIRPIYLGNNLPRWMRRCWPRIAWGWPPHLNKSTISPEVQNYFNNIKGQKPLSPRISSFYKCLSWILLHKSTTNYLYRTFYYCRNIVVIFAICWNTNNYSQNK